MPTKKKTETVIANPAEDGAAKEVIVAEVQEAEHTTEYDGVVYVLDEDSFDDLELIELLADYDATGNRLVIPKIVEGMIGEDQYAGFKAKYRNEKTGRVPFEPLRQLFFAIDRSLGE